MNAVFEDLTDIFQISEKRKINAVMKDLTEKIQISLKNPK